MAEEPAAERAHDEADREQGRGVQLLDDGIALREERAGEIEREGGESVEIVPFDEIADRADEDRPEAPAHIRKIELGTGRRRAVACQTAHPFSSPRFLRQPSFPGRTVAV